MEIVKKSEVEDLITKAIQEDIGTGDVTSEAIFPENHISKAVIVAKDEGVWCGGFMLKYVYESIDSSVKIDLSLADGASVSSGIEVAVIKGPTKSILEGERISLNFLQRLCGIATKTREITEILKDTHIQVLDTRKTLPGYRQLDKYAVRCGGGRNHRMGLYDMVMIKDNHIAAAGSINQAVSLVREAYGIRYIVEVETRNLREVDEALNTDADIIMLDNMDFEKISQAISKINGHAKIEISGMIDKKRIEKLKQLPVDYVSMGALTHSVTALDLSMKFC